MRHQILQAHVIPTRYKGRIRFPKHIDARIALSLQCETAIGRWRHAPPGNRPTQRVLRTVAFAMMSDRCFIPIGLRMDTLWAFFITFLCLLIVPVTSRCEEKGLPDATGKTATDAPTAERYRGPLPLPPRVENLKSTQRTGPVPPLVSGGFARGSHLGSIQVPSGPSPSEGHSGPLRLSTGGPLADTQKGNAGDNPPSQLIGSQDIDQIEVKLEVSGKVGDPKVGTSNLKLEATLNYEEQIIQRGDAFSQPIQAIRLYQNAEAKIWVNEALVQPTLREDRRYIGVSCADGKCELFCPNGPLTRDELDLLDVLANSVVIDLLFSKEPIRQGTEWDIPDQVLCSFLGLESVTGNTVKCRVGEIVAGGIARVEMSGNVRGVILGATTQ